MDHWRVKLPPAVEPPFEVWVNGILQQPGIDYEVRGRSLLFRRELVKEAPLGFWRWAIGAIGIGTYRRNDVVDVRYEHDGQPQIAHALDIEPPAGGASPER